MTETYSPSKHVSIGVFFDRLLKVLEWIGFFLGEIVKFILALVVLPIFVGHLWTFYSVSFNVFEQLLNEEFVAILVLTLCKGAILILSSNLILVYTTHTYFTSIGRPHLPPERDISWLKYVPVVRHFELQMLYKWLTFFTDPSCIFHMLIDQPPLKVVLGIAEICLFQILLANAIFFGITPLISLLQRATINFLPSLNGLAFIVIEVYTFFDIFAAFALMSILVLTIRDNSSNLRRFLKSVWTDILIHVFIPSILGFLLVTSTIKYILLTNPIAGVILNKINPNFRMNPQALVVYNPLASDMRKLNGDLLVIFLLKMFVLCIYILLGNLLVRLFDKAPNSLKDVFGQIFNLESFSLSKDNPLLITIRQFMFYFLLLSFGYILPLISANFLIAHRDNDNLIWDDIVFDTANAFLFLYIAVRYFQVGSYWWHQCDKLVSHSWIVNIENCNMKLLFAFGSLGFLNSAILTGSRMIGRIILPEACQYSPTFLICFGLYFGCFIYRLSRVIIRVVYDRHRGRDGILLQTIDLLIIFASIILVHVFFPFLFGVAATKSIPTTYHTLFILLSIGTLPTCLGFGGCFAARRERNEEDLVQAILHLNSEKMSSFRLDQYMTILSKKTLTVILVAGFYASPSFISKVTSIDILLAFVQDVLIQILSHLAWIIASIVTIAAFVGTGVYLFRPIPRQLVSRSIHEIEAVQ